MFDIYKPKEIEIEAEHLESDVRLTVPRRGSSKTPATVYVTGGNYLIKTSDGKIYPANKDLFELLFELKEK